MDMPYLVWRYDNDDQRQSVLGYKLLNDKQIRQLYYYVRARADKVLPPGRPDEIGFKRWRLDTTERLAKVLGIASRAGRSIRSVGVFVLHSTN
jgi:hypothetical protein